jgi:hypothetical protein
VADDHDFWGKTTARTRGLAMREESPNGGAERRLASCEGMAVSHLDVGEKAEERGEALAVERFYSWGREGGDRGPTHQRQGASNLPIRRYHGAHRFPLSWVFDGWALVGF